MQENGIQKKDLNVEIMKSVNEFQENVWNPSKILY